MDYRPKPKKDVRFEHQLFPEHISRNDLCEVIDCLNTVRDRKAVCSDHVHLLSYPASIISQLAEAEKEAKKALRRPNSINPKGFMATEVVVAVESRGGACSLACMIRDVPIFNREDGELLAEYCVEALKKAGIISTKVDSRNRIFLKVLKKP